MDFTAALRAAIENLQDSALDETNAKPKLEPHVLQAIEQLSQDHQAPWRSAPKSNIDRPNAYARAEPNPGSGTKELENEINRIAQELDLSGDLSKDELQRRRRMFAARHHPDRLPPELRQKATRRMTIANMLVDQAQSMLAARTTP